MYRIITPTLVGCLLPISLPDGTLGAQISSALVATYRAQCKKTKTLATPDRVRINHFIRAAELRVIGDNGENYGVLSLGDALKKAEELGLDLIEISPLATPPVAKIMDFGKFQYDQNKKQKQTRVKSHTVETKSLQIKVGTGEHDLDLKAKKASEWLREGNRVKIDLFLPGRTKYMDLNFLKERLERVLKLIAEPYKIADEAKKGPKGLVTVIERDTTKK